MKKLFISLFAFILNVSAFSQKYFEGIVEFDITYEIINPAVTEEWLIQVLGSKMKFYIKNGSYLREYIDEQKNIVRKIIYLPSNNRAYFVNKLNPDTVIYVDLSKKLFDDYKITKGANDTVLGCLCPSWSVAYKYYDKLSEDTVSMKEEYFFCHQLAVNPDYYKKYYIWYDIIREEKSIALKFTEQWGDYYRVIYTAKEYNEATLSENIFNVDKNVVLVNKFKDQ